MNKYSSDMKKEIERILRSRFTRGDIQTATNELLDLFNVSKRFNLPNFFVGVLVGLTLGLVILHFAL
jgi:hypothetical protein